MAITKTVVSIILLYLGLLSINFSFFPLGPRTIYSILALFLILKSKQLNLFLKSSEIVNSFGYLFIWGGLSLISVTIYGTKDFYFISFIISQLNSLLSSLFLAYVLYFKFKYNSDKIIDLAIVSIFIFEISGILMFAFPDIKDLILSITVRSSNYEQEFLNNTGFRLIGFGPTFFGAGVMSGLGLILLSYRLTSKLDHKVSYALYILVYIIVLFSGLLASRSTLIGFFISLFILIFNTNSFRIKRLIPITGILLILFWITMYMISNSEKMNITHITRFGFEFYYNFIETGKLQTSSSENLMEMIKFPKSFYTYILGDGYFVDPTTSFFYQGTDIGYLRIIYYSGVFALISIMIYYYKLFYSKWLLMNNKKIIINSLFLYLIVLYFKGLTDFNDFMFIFLIVSYFQQSENIQQNDAELHEKNNFKFKGNLQYSNR